MIIIVGDREKEDNKNKGDKDRKRQQNTCVRLWFSKRCKLISLLCLKMNIKMCIKNNRNELRRFLPENVCIIVVFTLFSKICAVVCSGVVLVTQTVHLLQDIQIYKTKQSRLSSTHFTNTSNKRLTLRDLF